MPRTCTVCSHPKRSEIDRAVLAGESYRSIAKRLRIPAMPVYRHKPHVSERMAAAVERNDEKFGDNLVADLKNLAIKATEIGAAALKEKQYGASMAGVREMVRISELIARLTGQLDESTRIAVVVQQRDQREAAQLEDLSRLDLPERLEFARLLSKVRGVDADSLALPMPNSTDSTRN